MEERERGCVWLCSASLTLDEKQMRHHQKRCRGGWAGCPQAPTPGPCSALQRPLAPFPAPPPNLPASLSRSLGILPQGFQAHANFPPHQMPSPFGSEQSKFVLFLPANKDNAHLSSQQLEKLLHLFCFTYCCLQRPNSKVELNQIPETVPENLQLNSNQIQPIRTALTFSVLHQMHQPSRWRPDPDLESS